MCVYGELCLALLLNVQLSSHNFIIQILEFMKALRKIEAKDLPIFCVCIHTHTHPYLYFSLISKMNYP